MPSEPRPIQVHGTPGFGTGPVAFRAMTACDCGCGLKDRFEFKVGRDEVAIDDPEPIRLFIEEMVAGFKLLFPDAKQPCEPSP
jgi:hypothetical protein